MERVVLPLKRAGFVEPEQVPYPEAPGFPLVKDGVGRIGLANVDETYNHGTVPGAVAAIFESKGEGYSRNLMRGYVRYFSGLLDGLEVVETDDRLELVDADGFTPASLRRASSQVLFSLGLEMFLAAHGLNADDVEWREDALLVRKEGAVLREIPLAGGQSLLVNWLQAWQSELDVEHVPMAYVLQQANALGDAARAKDVERLAELQEWFTRFKDKVVFVGPTDATLKDLAPTPFDTIPVPKVGVHANVYRTIFDEAYIREISRTADFCVCALLTVLVSGLALWSGRGGDLPALLRCLCCLDMSAGSFTPSSIRI